MLLLNSLLTIAISDFERQLLIMKQLYLSVEQQFVEFNEIIPYNQNNMKNGWDVIHSPRLVNLILSICPQIEKMSKLLVDEMNLKLKNDGKSLYDYLNRLDAKDMLKEQIVGLPNPGSTNILLQPFLRNSNEDIVWWLAYNKIKHNVIGGIEYGTLSNAINALAGLSTLHHIAHIVITFKNYHNVNMDEEILDFTKWHYDEEQGLQFQNPNEKLMPNQLSVVWSSNVFFFCSHRSHWA